MKASLACLATVAAVEAAIRLRRSLPCREHKIGDDSHATGKRGLSAPKPIYVAGVRYDTAAAAAKAHDVSKTTIQNWLCSAKFGARYSD